LLCFIVKEKIFLYLEIFCVKGAEIIWLKIETERIIV